MKETSVLGVQKGVARTVRGIWSLASRSQENCPNIFFREDFHGVEDELEQTTVFWSISKVCDKHPIYAES